MILDNGVSMEKVEENMKKFQDAQVISDNPFADICRGCPGCKQCMSSDSAMSCAIDAMVNHFKAEGEKQKRISSTN